MNILSLFDGMSCGQIALERAGIKYDNYFASEIDKHAIKVTQHNYPNTIQLGDVTKIDTSILPKIDLLIGGSPCQGFSFSGKQLNFEDPRSKLFFEYVKIKEQLEPTYFLLENVFMKKEYQDVITKYLKVEPILINSSLVSAQNRKRLYWTNIPNLKQPKDKKILLKDIIDDKTELYVNWTQERMNRFFNNGYIRRDFYYVNKLNKKVQCLMAYSGGNQPKLWDNTKKNVFRLLTRNELERLQTVPDDYTSIVSYDMARTMLGNGWTIDVIAHIFKNIGQIDLQNKLF